MAIIIDCTCPIPLGSQECETRTGIAELYYTPYKNITSIAFAPTANACCLEGEIASFGTDAGAPDGLLQPIDFVKQEDDTGALFAFEETVDGGSVVYQYTLTFQINSNNPDEECAIRSMLNREIAFLFKGKDGKWKFINWSGGAKVTGNVGDTNTSYKTVTLSGRVNDPALFVSYADNGVWADSHLVPVSVDPLLGLINA